MSMPMRKLTSLPRQPAVPSRWAGAWSTVLAVHHAGRLGGDVSALDVPQHLLARPAARIAPASAAAGYQAGDVALLQMQAGRLAEAPPCAAVARYQLDVVGRPAASAVHPPGHVLEATEGCGEIHALIAQDAVIAYQSETATELTSAGVAGVQRVLVDENPVLLLADLDRDDVGLAVTYAHQAGLTVLVEARAPASGLRLDQDGQLAGIRMRAGEDQPAHAEEVAGCHALRHVWGERLPHQVDRVEQRLPVGRDGGRPDRREDVALGTDHPQRPEAAFVDRCVRVGQRLEDGPHPAHEAGPCAVDRSGGLRARAAEVREELVVGDRHADPYGDGCFGQAVVIDPVLGEEGAFGQLSHVQVHLTFTLLEQVRDPGLHQVDAIPAAHLVEPPGGHPQAGRLRVQVAQRHLRRANVGADDVDQAG